MASQAAARRSAVMLVRQEPGETAYEIEERTRR